jgi:hypothetical protein
MTDKLRTMARTRYGLYEVIDEYDGFLVLSLPFGTAVVPREEVFEIFTEVRK